MEKLITKTYNSEIEEIDSLIDSVAESAFKTLLAECDNLSELESRAFCFDHYSDVTAETARLYEMVASKVRKKVKLYIANIKTQYKIALGE